MYFSRKATIKDCFQLTSLFFSLEENKARNPELDYHSFDLADMGYSNDFFIRCTPPLWKALFSYVRNVPFKVWNSSFGVVLESNSTDKEGVGLSIENKKGDPGL